MANFFSGLAQTAVKAAPFAAQVVAQREAKQKADLAAALAQMHQQSEDNTKNIAANVAAGVGIANIGHINAETDKLQKPTPKVMRGPGGQLVTYDEDNPTQASTFGPAPIPKAPTAEPLVPVMQHGKRVYVKRSEAAGLEAPEPAAPQQSFTPFQGTNLDGQPVVRPFNTKTGQFGPVADVAPKPGAAAGGSASLSADDRAKMLSQAKLDNETMKAYETDVLAGRKHVGTAAGVAGATSDAHGGVLNNVIGVLGNTATGALDADYQKYLTAQRSYGRIMGNLQSKRYTDHQAEIERSISGLQGNDLPGTIQYKQSLRDASLADVVPSVTSSPAARGRGGPPPNVPHPQNRNDRPGPPNIGGGHSGDAEAAWAAKNPPHPGESFEAYHARFVTGGAP